jgi:hypothetical protein
MTWARRKKEMTRKGAGKPYWEMTGDELAEATKAFDEEFVADGAQPLSPEMQVRWERARAQRPAPGKGREQTSERGGDQHDEAE